MNAHRPPCESQLESLSWLAADCLAPAAERDVRQHLAMCAACRTRFAELAAVCGGLRHARPAPADGAADVVARAMAEIAEEPEVGRDAAWARAPRSRWLLGAGAAIAASVLAAVVWRSLFVAVPPAPNVVRQQQPEVVPAPAVHPPVTVIAVAGAPTWLALQRAFAQSDEAFDALLARNGDVLACAPCDARSFLQE